MADLEDVTENLTAMIRGCETFVAQRVAHMESESEQTIHLSVKAVHDDCRKQINDMEERMTNSIRKIKEENVEEINRIHQHYDKVIQNMSEKLKRQEKCKCQDLYEAYVTAGKLVFSDKRFVVLEKEKEPSVAAVVDIGEGEPTANFATESGTQGVCSAQTQQQPQPQPQRVEEVASEVLGVQPPVYATIEDVPEALRCQLVKYANPRQKSVTTDKLNILQQMYFHFFMETKVREEENIADIANRLMGAGIRDRIWSRTFLPAGIANLLEYLKLRIKNYRFQRRLRKEQASQAERLAGEVTKAKKMKKK